MRGQNEGSGINALTNLQNFEDRKGGKKHPKDFSFYNFCNISVKTTQISLMNSGCQVLKSTEVIKWYKNE